MSQVGGGRERMLTGAIAAPLALVAGIAGLWRSKKREKK